MRGKRAKQIRKAIREKLDAMGKIGRRRHITVFDGSIRNAPDTFRALYQLVKRKWREA